MSAPLGGNKKKSSNPVLVGVVAPLTIGLFRLAVRLALAPGKPSLIKTVQASILDLLDPSNSDQVSSRQP